MAPDRFPLLCATEWPLTIYAGRMGKSSDPDAVIDSRARVYGVTGLRVVDASAFAILPPGHPMSTICESCLRTFQKFGGFVLMIR